LKLVQIDPVGLVPLCGWNCARIGLRLLPVRVPQNSTPGTLDRRQMRFAAAEKIQRSSAPPKLAGNGAHFLLLKTCITWWPAPLPIV